jgi:hypothetical protein
MYADIRQRILIMHLDLADRMDEIKGLLVKNVKEGSEIADSPSPALPSVPEYLAEKFKANALQTRSTEPFPLAEGVDAVAFHFEESTRNFRSFAPLNLTPKPAQYLNLMKCVWLMQQIKSNPSFEVACHDTLWKAYVLELETKIISETERFATVESPLQIPGPSDILREPAGNFGIWVDLGEVDPFPTLTEPDGFEQKIFEVSLPNVSNRRKEDIMVFRLGETRIRLVRVVTSTISKHKEVEGHEIDAEKVHLLPFYAFPNNSLPSLSIGWRASGSEKRSQALTFRSVSDIHQLQQAITNFGVVYDSLGVKEVRIKISSMFSSIRSIGTNGRVQVWTHRPPQAQNFASPSAENVASPFSGGQEFASSGLLSHTTSSGSGWAKSYAVSTNPSSEMQQMGRTALLRYPVSSRIVIFAASKTNDKVSHRFISIPVTEKIRLSPENCQCNKPSRNCMRVVITSIGKLDIRVYDTKGQDENWNLAVLRWPKHVDIGLNLEVLKAINFITLDFTSVGKRMEFTETFEMARLIMQHRVESYWRDRGGVRTQHVVQDDPHAL